MRTATSREWCRVRLTGVGLLLTAAAGCAAPHTPPSPAAAVSPTQARIWFYQQFLPGEAMTTAAVAIDGSAAGTSRPGYRFYRDVAPGSHHLGVASDGTDVRQDGDVALAPGETVYVKIASLRSWASAFNYGRDTFYVRPMPTLSALAEIAQTTD